ncbi:radical SAM protein [Streptomyces sp. SID12501]|uniref:Radical SAM protein n=1 Tax=Streptomyces sp. SID12501 TaxID=2706042 RepID=A0A6B3C0A6_9ACTN|nr:radical SAM protein [Streptomyces sp. SID12501]NEC89964.1 radical SAM protein [Streptomyces sp. SID12501]
MRSDDLLLDLPSAPFELTDLRKNNQQLNIAEYQSGATVLESRPLALFIELTQNCNLRCPMCRFGEKYDPKLNLDEAVFDRLTEELFPTAHVVDLRGWGESTMLPQFGEFVARAVKHRVQLRLVTNGMVNRRPVWDMMMRAHAMVTVSCDAASPELFAKLRAGGTIERLVGTVESLVEARDRHGAPRENVCLNVVSSIDNLGELADIVRLAARLDVPLVSIHPLVTGLDDPSHLRNDLERTQQAYEEAAETGRREGVVVQLGAAPDPSLALPDMVRRPACMHPWSYAYVRYNGQIGFCDHLIGGDSDYTFGSVADQSFEEIWNGRQWQGLRAAHVSGDIPEDYMPCRWTYAQRYIEFEHLLHPDRASGLVTSETHQQVTLRRDPSAVPWAPWKKEELGSGVLIPASALTDSLRQSRPTSQ